MHVLLYIIAYIKKIKAVGTTGPQRIAMTTKPWDAFKTTSANTVEAEAQDLASSPTSPANATKSGAIWCHPRMMALIFDHPLLRCHVFFKKSFIIQNLPIIKHELL